MELIDQILRAKYARESYPNDDWKLTGRWERNKFNFHESTNANIFSFQNYENESLKRFLMTSKSFIRCQHFLHLKRETSKICNMSYEKLAESLKVSTFRLIK